MTLVIAVHDGVGRHRILGIELLEGDVCFGCSSDLKSDGDANEGNQKTGAEGEKATFKEDVTRVYRVM